MLFYFAVKKFKFTQNKLSIRSVFNIIRNEQQIVFMYLTFVPMIL